MPDTSNNLRADLSGQVAIVTGASQGLGKAMAIELARNGAKVACVARSVEKLAETVKAITEAGGTAEAFAADVKDKVSVEKAIEEVTKKWERLDILVNNAAIGGFSTPLHELPPETCGATPTVRDRPEFHNASSLQVIYAERTRED